MSENNKDSLPFGDLDPYFRPFGPIFSWAPGGTAPLFFHSFDRVYEFT